MDGKDSVSAFTVCLRKGIAPLLLELEWREFLDCRVCCCVGTTCGSTALLLSIQNAKSPYSCGGMAVCGAVPLAFVLDGSIRRYGVSTMHSYRGRPLLFERYDKKPEAMHIRFFHVVHGSNGEGTKKTAPKTKRKCTDGTTTIKTRVSYLWVVCPLESHESI